MWGHDYGRIVATAEDEWLAALHHLWSRPGEAFSGEHVRFDGGGLGLEPAVARPPITVAATGPASMGIAARHADVWEASYLSAAEFAALGRRFPQIAETTEGRTRPVLRSLEVDAVTAGTAAARHRLEQRFLGERGQAGPAALPKALTGTGDELAAQLAAYRSAGTDQLVIAALDPHNLASGGECKRIIDSALETGHERALADFLATQTRLMASEHAEARLGAAVALFRSGGRPSLDTGWFPLGREP